MKNKYEEFYFENDKNYPDSAYWDLYDKNAQEAIRKYKGHMYCPLCNLAPLTVANGKSLRYFKVIEADMDKHEQACSYRLEKANRKETEKFYEELDRADIENRLASCMNKMLKSIAGTGIGNLEKTNTKTKGVKDFLTITTEGNRKKYLPHKSLYSKNLDDEIDVTKIYYGKCAVYLYPYIPKGEEEVKTYYLKILNSETKKQICDISISPYIYKYLEDILALIPIDKKDAQNYYLCFAVRLEKKDYSYNCRLKDSRLIELEREL